MAELFLASSVVMPAITSLVVTGALVPLWSEWSRRRDRKNEIYKALYAEKLKAATSVSIASSALIDAAQNLIVAQGRLEDLVGVEDTVPRSRNFIRAQYLQKRDEFAVAILASFVAEGDEIVATFQNDKGLTELERARVVEPIIKAKLVVSQLGMVYLQGDTLPTQNLLQGTDVPATFIEPFIRRKRKQERSGLEIGQNALRDAFENYNKSIDTYVSARSTMQAAIRSSQWLLGAGVWNDGLRLAQITNDYAIPGDDNAPILRSEQEARYEWAWTALDALSYGIGVVVHQDELADLIPARRTSSTAS